MQSGIIVFFALGLLFVSTVGVPLRSSGPGLMRFKDGKPVALPLIRAPVPTEGSYALEQSRINAEELARRYVDELLTQEIKLQMDKTNLEKFVTEMIMWRKRTFPSARV